MQVYFWEFQRKNETERLRTLFMPEGGVKLKNLTGYTTYMISVAPFNAAGDGPRSPPTRGRTQQAGTRGSVPTSIAIPCAGGGGEAGRVFPPMTARMMLIRAVSTPDGVSGASR